MLVSLHGILWCRARRRFVEQTQFGQAVDQVQEDSQVIATRPDAKRAHQRGVQ